MKMWISYWNWGYLSLLTVDGRNPTNQLVCQKPGNSGINYLPTGAGFWTINSTTRLAYLMAWYPWNVCNLGPVLPFSLANLGLTFVIMCQRWMAMAMMMMMMMMMLMLMLMLMMMKRWQKSRISSATSQTCAVGFFPSGDYSWSTLGDGGEPQQESEGWNTSLGL